MDKRDFTIDAAPLQGYTDAPWRHWHSRTFGGIDTYHLPFSRVENGEVRRHDLRELHSPLDEGIATVAQAIARDGSEFERILTAVLQSGRTRLDLNMGCPFPPQVRKGRGAGLIAAPGSVGDIADVMSRYGDRMEFSVKMRLGVKDPEEWKGIIDIINGMPLSRVVIHPRVATQQYGGELYIKEASKFMAECAHPVVYNGDIVDAAGIEEAHRILPDTVGLMIGRGLLVRPWIASEWRGEKWYDERIAEAMRALHDGIFSHYEKTLCGETQLLMKMKSYWDYCGETLPRKLVKAARKAGTVANYLRAVENLFNNFSDTTD